MGDTVPVPDIVHIHVLVVEPVAQAFVIASISHLLHLCDETVEARQQFFDERSGKPITS
jgi:hypothetical protein